LTILCTPHDPYVPTTPPPLLHPRIDAYALLSPVIWGLLGNAAAKVVQESQAVVTNWDTCFRRPKTPEVCRCIRAEFQRIYTTFHQMLSQHRHRHSWYMYHNDYVRVSLTVTRLDFGEYVYSQLNVNFWFILTQLAIKNKKCIRLQLALFREIMIDLFARAKNNLSDYYKLSEE